MAKMTIDGQWIRDVEVIEDGVPVIRHFKKTNSWTDPVKWRKLKRVAVDAGLPLWKILDDALAHYVYLLETKTIYPGQTPTSTQPKYVRFPGDTPVLDTDFPGGKFPKELEDDRDHASEDFQRDAEYDAEERRQRELEADDLDGILKEKGED